MESSGQGTQPALVHYTTGALTVAQADAIARWRDRLEEDTPLPGFKPKGPALRAIGIDDRPPASSPT